MRFCRVLFFVFLLAIPALAGDLRVKVVDPQSAAVFGAQVELLPQQGGARGGMLKLLPLKAWQSFTTFRTVLFACKFWRQALGHRLSTYLPPRI